MASCAVLRREIFSRIFQVRNLHRKLCWTEIGVEKKPLAKRGKNAQADGKKQIMI